VKKESPSSRAIANENSIINLSNTEGSIRGFENPSNGLLKDMSFDSAQDLYLKQYTELRTNQLINSSWELDSVVTRDSYGRDKPKFTDFDIPTEISFTLSDSRNEEERLVSTFTFKDDQKATIRTNMSLDSDPKSFYGSVFFNMPEKWIFIAPYNKSIGFDGKLLAKDPNTLIVQMGRFDGNLRADTILIFKRTN
jgi:hypothetical protein